MKSIRPSDVGDPQVMFGIVRQGFLDLPTLHPGKAGEVLYIYICIHLFIFLYVCVPVVCVCVCVSDLMCSDKVLRRY